MGESLFFAGVGGELVLCDSCKKPNNASCRAQVEANAISACVGVLGDNKVQKRN